ncbi:DMT family transporter [Phyllobacterium leguminum]|uniref:Drug/metabolite transporter (DMT)-like permease n=1 Tax=Phyllobacterium leguminum TaxID=314237 RepID=A0A318T1C9_9HYPH|nr:DMT family transporter [Phyllobacterium leguminum]PYE88277.1 drug/metabolite transporter (DMT)-like permease [Phyllobacterium leguminum]
MALSPNIRSSIFMMLAMASFTINDSITKYLSESMNTGQIMLLRGTLATMVVLLLARQRKALVSPRKMLHPMIILRAVGELGATITYLVALANLSLGFTSAIFQSVPLAVTLLAAIFLKEQVGWRRWLAITTGFVGVLIIVRPGADGINPYALMLLVGVVFTACRDLATRRIPDTMPTLMISALTSFIVTLTGAGLIVPMGGWSPVGWGEAGFLMIAAILLLIGYHFIILAMRAGEISFVAPFRYTSLLWSILLGFVIFGDIPNIAMIIGSVIVVSSGIYMLYRESVVSRRGRIEARAPEPAALTEAG